MNGRAHMLIVAIVLAAVMSVMVAMAIMPIRTQSQRLREAELVYRGEHIADGIRRFYFRQRRFPFELEELIELEPRMVRSLYKDPMTPEGEWELIYLEPQNNTQVRVLRRLVDPQDEAQTQGSESGSPSGQDEDSVFAIKTRQIVGVRSSSNRTGLRNYQESQIYSDWEFTALPKKKNVLDQVLGQ